MLRSLSLLLLLLPLGCTAQSCSPACSSKATCVDGECLCDDGYAALAGVESLFCADIDECATGTAGCDAEFGFCVDYDPPIKFQCGCLPGYTCQNLPACTSCIVDTTHACNINNGGCDPSETCTPIANNGTICTSTVDITDPPTDAPVPTCESAACDPVSSTCELVSGTPTCVCNTGFLEFRGACADIDECMAVSTNNCTVDRSVCVNLPGSHRCQCQTNFTDFPGSIRGTDCRTDAEIELAFAVGSTLTVGTGLSGITAADLAPGTPARASLIDFFANKFDINASSVTLSNITETTSRRMREDSRELQISAVSFFVSFQVTSSALGTTFGTTSTTTGGSTTTTTFVEPDTIAETIQAKVDEINEFFETIGGTDADGESLALDQAAVDTYISDVVEALTSDGVEVDEDAMRETNVVALTFVSDLVTLAEVTAQDAVDSGVDNEIVQALQESGLSGTPTAAPSATVRFLGAEEEEDFFGDFATSVCRCVDCEPLSGCEDIWRGGDAMMEGVIPQTETHVVVDYCVDDLSWIPAFLSDVQIASVTIVSRCGNIVNSPFADANILTFEHDVGTNDVFLSWIVGQYDEDMTGTVLFLQDRPPLTTSGARLVNVAERSSFACSSSPPHSDEVYAESKSVYCRTDSLKKEFWDEIGLSLGGELVQVCDSMTFAATLRSIRNKEKSLWESLASRADHMTQEWATLLAQPLVGEDLDSVLQYSNEEVDGCLYHKIPTVVKEEEKEEDTSSLTTTINSGMDYLKTLVKW